MGHLKEREGIWLSIGSDRDDDRSRKYTSKKMKSKFEFYYDYSSSEDEEEQVFKNYSIDKLDFGIRKTCNVNVHSFI